ncbi:MAG: hypothetical protein ABI690_03930 [Chloroflexota bacterium]
MSSSTSNLLAADAVSANRRNELTARQRDSLLNQSSNSGWLGCGLAAILIVPVVLIAGKWLEQHEIIGFAVIIGILIVSFLIAGRIVSIPMRRRLSNAQIQQVSGEVVWHGSAYVALVDGRPLRSIYNDGVNLVPGKYTFFRLQHSDWLLSAQHLDPNASAVVNNPAPTRDDFAIHELQSALNSTNGFRVADLSINKEGRLSPRQRMSLLRNSASSLILAVIVIVFAVFIVVVGLRDKPDDILGLLAVVGVFIVIGYFIFSDLIANIGDTLSGRVEVVSGTGSKYTTQGRRQRHINYHYRIDNLSFSVSQAAYDAFIENVPYRAYYAPHTKTLVNMEVG